MEGDERGNRARLGGNPFRGWPCGPSIQTFDLALVFTLLFTLALVLVPDLDESLAFAFTVAGRAVADLTSWLARCRDTFSNAAMSDCFMPC